MDLKRLDYSHRYLESTQETLRVMYQNRNEAGETIESINDVIYRVATAVAIAELKYIFSPEDLILLTLEVALQHPKVVAMRDAFADAIGEQKFWANTPANINADPEVSLKVLKYGAYGKLRGLSEDRIWLDADRLINAYEKGDCLEELYEKPMAKLACEIKGKGCLAACGVAFVTDSLDGIQEAARMETMATKGAMGMGLNTSRLRPWASIVANGAAASGPDRFYEKSIAKAVEAVAQGGRRGGALIELRNSDHPDILLFIEKKRLVPPPSMAAIYQEVSDRSTKNSNESDRSYKLRLVNEAERLYGERYAFYLERQNYLKNTNVTVLAMPGFMEAVRDKQWYPCTFDGELWDKPIYDPCKPTGTTNKLTKEKELEEYSVSLSDYPEAFNPPDGVRFTHHENDRFTVHSWLFGPEVFDRITAGMQDSGEPGIMFYETVNDANANDHVYDLDTCNPCGEQCLPAGHAKKSFAALKDTPLMGVCNLSSLHAAHESFWVGGEYDWQGMSEVVKLQQRFMDNVTDVSWFPLTLQNMTARIERRNGGGFAGIAEFLSRKEVAFGSEEGLFWTERLFYEYNKASLEASLDLAQERGVYPLWEGSQYEKLGLRVRNTCMTNNAPTGTLAQMMQTSWGIEPHSGIVFSRKVRTVFVDFVAPGFEDMMRKYDAWPETEEGQKALKQQIRDNHKSVQGLSTVPREVQRAFLIRPEISPEQYVKHLAAIHDAAADCPYVFNSVSNTCSIPHGFDTQQIKDAIMLAWKLGVKDLTFYPDGARLSQPFEKIAKEGHQKSNLDLLTLLNVSEDIEKLDIDETSGKSYKVKMGTPEGTSTLHASLNHMVGRDGELVELYARSGKSGAIESCLFEALGRVISSFLQFAAEYGSHKRQHVEDLIVKQLLGMSSGNPTWHRFKDEEKPVVISSPCDAIAFSIKQYRKAHSKSTESRKTVVTEQLVDVIPVEQVRGVMCRKCSSRNVTNESGCMVCLDCSYSRCS